MSDQKSRIRCLRCGYDVHSVASEGVCPECGASVDLARGRVLEEAGRGLRRIREGLRLTAAGLIGSAALFIASLPVAFVAWSPSATVGVILLRTYLLSLDVTRMTCLASVTVGVWWAASSLPPGSRRVRLIARIAAIAWLLNAQSPIPLFWAQLGLGAPSSWWIMDIVGVSLAAMILLAIARFGQVASVLAEGEPSAQTGRPIRVAYWAIGGVAVAGGFCQNSCLPLGWGHMRALCSGSCSWCFAVP